MTSLYYQIKKYFPGIIKNLDREDEFLLMDDYFETKCCHNCSSFRWGEKKWTEIEENPDGETACCLADNILIKLDYSPDGDPLSGLEALKWWFDEGRGGKRGFYLLGKCKGYDGEIPYSKEQIIDFIERRNKLLERIINFKAENIFDEPPDYFVKNLYSVKRGLIDSRKLQFGNPEHIAMIKGEMPFSKELYKNIKVAV